MAIMGILLSAPSRAQSLLKPPYGLRWGDSPEKLIAWASRHSLDLTISLPGDQPALRVVKVSPQKGFLPGTQASALEGRFMLGKLYEVTVHYEDPDASAAQSEERFETLRKQLSVEYGSLQANQQQRTVNDQFVTRTQSFHREPVQGLFLMFALTEVEDLLREQKELKFSLIYRNDNLRREIEKLTKAERRDSAPAMPQR